MKINEALTWNVKYCNIGRQLQHFTPASRAPFLIIDLIEPMNNLIKILKTRRTARGMRCDGVAVIARSRPFYILDGFQMTFQPCIIFISLRYSLPYLTLLYLTQ